MSGRQRNAMYYALCAIAGSSVAASVWLLSFAPIPLVRVVHADDCGCWAFFWSNWLRLLVFLGPLALGLPIAFWGESRLKRGFADEIWSEAELQPVRALPGKPLWGLVEPPLAGCRASQRAVFIPAYLGRKRLSLPPYFAFAFGDADAAVPGIADGE